jgi:hypothetical protein
MQAPVAGLLPEKGTRDLPLTNYIMFHTLNWMRVRKKMSWPTSRQYVSICQEGVRKAM